MAIYLLRSIFTMIFLTFIHAVFTRNTYASEITGITYTSSQRTITTMVNDDNYLWAGTCGQGLLRIDKVNGTTTVFSLSSTGYNIDCVHTLVFDHQGALIIGTSQGGIVRFSNKSWEQLPGLSNPNVLQLAIDNKGSIWAQLQSAGIVRQNGGTWQPVFNRFSGMLMNDPTGNIWIATTPQNASGLCDDGEIYQYVNGELHSTISLASVCSEITYPAFTAADGKKKCWIGTYTILLECDEKAIYRYAISNDTTPSRSLTALAVNNNNQLLLALTDYTESCKLCFFDPGNDRTQLFDSVVVTLHNQYITALCADSKEGFWCASSNGTIIRIDKNNHYSFLTTGNSVLPSNTIRSLLVDTSGDIWVGTANGIARYNGTQWNCYSPATGDTLCGLDVSSLALDSSGYIWAGFQQPLYSSMTQAGISYFIDQHWRGLKLDHFSVKNIAVDANGDQWIVCDDGVYRYHDMIAERLFETVYSSDKYIALGTSVKTITFDDKNIPWIGTGLGVKKYENGIWNDDTSLHRFLADSSISVNTGINVVTYHHTTLWIGTTNGLFKWSDSTCEHFDTTGTVLPDNTIQCIAVDAPDKAWIGTSRGLVHLDGTNYRIYTTGNSALCDNSITALAVAPTGQIWVGTSMGGLTVLSLREVSPTNRSALIPRIESPITVTVNTTSRNFCRIAIMADQSAGIVFSLLSLQGKLIKRFTTPVKKDGIYTLVWDGTDRYNQFVSSGMYLFVAMINNTCIGSTLLQH